MNFTGTQEYVATAELQMAVNAAIQLQKPLLIKGEPGTGKTMLAEQVAKALDLPLIQWHIKSTTKAQQGLYEYDAVSRLRDSQLGDEKVHDISNYIIQGKIWQAFESGSQSVLLIDEIDKAGRAFLSSWNLPINSAARCRLSEADPPLPIKINLPPASIVLMHSSETSLIILERPL